MSKVKIVHTADMHLGSIFSGLSCDNAGIRQNETLRTALNVIKRAEGSDILLLSGDIFDTSDISRSVLDSFLDAVASIPETKFFYSCGNHDAYYTQALTYCRENSPANLFVFPPDKVSCVTLEDKKTRIYGCSYSAENTQGTMLGNISACDDDYINILCTHSDFTQEAYNPCSIDLMEQLGFDYIALGHIHSYSGIKSKGSLFYAYPGIPEPRGFDECGRGGCIVGEVSKNEKKLEFIEFQKRKYIDETVDISDFKNEIELLEVLSSMAESTNNICRFTLVGENNSDISLNTTFIEKNLNCFHTECIDKTTLSISVENYTDFPGLKGMCARKTLSMLEKSAEDEEKEKMKKAFKILLQCFEAK